MVVAPVGSQAVAQDRGATPRAEPLVGVTVEELTNSPPLPFRPRDTTAMLARYTFEPDGLVNYPYPGPILVYVESGTLTLEGVGPSVSILHPPREIVRATTDAGPEVAVEQIGESPAEGDAAEIAAGGSAYSADGALGTMRNVTDAPLVLLVVAFATYESESGEATAVAEDP